MPAFPPRVAPQNAADSEAGSPRRAVGVKGLDKVL